VNPGSTSEAGAPIDGAFLNDVGRCDERIAANPRDPPSLFEGEGRAQMKTPAQGPGFSSLEAVGFQCITVTANTTIMAALQGAHDRQREKLFTVLHCYPHI
jgi:hypothetical protein